MKHSIYKEAEVKKEGYYNKVIDPKDINLNLKTSFEWNNIIGSKFNNFRVLDADGWNRNNWGYSWFEERITIIEFRNRLQVSTIIANREVLEFINNLCKENENN